ncbi:MAG TPA: hypothetical protein VNF29_14020 [Candidatus Binataceae bacterium]|nr:hypothetical protein [Candidatus Binataceae bacterium]
MDGGDKDKVDQALPEWCADVRAAICAHCGRNLVAHLLAAYYAVEIGHLFEDLCSN